MRLRWLFILVFAVGLVLSFGFGLNAGQASSGWGMAALMSLLGLFWTAWGEPESRREMKGQPELEREAPQPSPLKWTGLNEPFELRIRSNEAGRETQGPRKPEDLAPSERSGGSDESIATPPTPAPMVASDDWIRRLEEYFDLAPVPLVVISRDGHIERMNRAAEAVTEFAAAEVRRQPYWNVFLQEAEANRARDDYHAAMFGKTAPPRRETWQTRRGARAQFEWWRTVLKDEFGMAAGVLAAAMPVADGGPAVDLMALADQLTAVNGYSEMLLMSMASEDPIRLDLESIHRAGMAASFSLSAHNGA